MASFINSLQTKLTASFIILIILITGLTFIYTYGETRAALKASTQDELMEVAGLMATQIRAEDAISMKPGMEGTPAHLALRDHLVKMRSMSTQITNAYIMKIEGDGTVIFLLDDIYGIEPDPALIGDVYLDAPMEEIRAGLSSPSASNDFYSDKWGTFLSGYAPIKDATGSTVAVLGVDMTADKVIARQDFIGNTIYLIMAIAAIIAGLMIFVFARTIICDIRKLNETANRVSMGDMAVMVDVHRKDEIGDLARSFSRMVASLKIMMMKDESE
jgi:adenylate cyclase